MLDVPEWIVWIVVGAVAVLYFAWPRKGPFCESCGTELKSIGCARGHGVVGRFHDGTAYECPACGTRWFHSSALGKRIADPDGEYWDPWKPIHNYQGILQTLLSESVDDSEANRDASGSDVKEFLCDLEAWARVLKLKSWNPTMDLASHIAPSIRAPAADVDAVMLHMRSLQRSTFMAALAKSTLHWSHLLNVGPMTVFRVHIGSGPYTPILRCFRRGSLLDSDAASHNLIVVRHRNAKSARSE